MEKELKDIFGIHLASFMAFSTVWAFGNIVNGYSSLADLIYFLMGFNICYLLLFHIHLLFGELGSTFKDAGGGVSSWISKTHSKLIAYCKFGQYGV